MPLRRHSLRTCAALSRFFPRKALNGHRFYPENNTRYNSTITKTVSPSRRSKPTRPRAHGTQSTSDKELGVTTTAPLAGPDLLAGLRQQVPGTKDQNSQSLRDARTTQTCLVFMSQRLQDIRRCRLSKRSAQLLAWYTYIRPDLPRENGHSYKSFIHVFHIQRNYILQSRKQLECTWHSPSLGQW